MATKRRLRLFLRLSLAGTLIGVAYGSFMGRAFRGTALIGSLVGAIGSPGLGLTGTLPRDPGEDDRNVVRPTTFIGQVY
jgi:hypothetical protein